MTFITLVVITVLCLSIPLSRMHGVIGLAITLILYPYHTLALLCVLLIAGSAIRYHQRRKSNASTKPLPRRT